MLSGEWLIYALVLRPDRRGRPGADRHARRLRLSPADGARAQGQLLWPVRRTAPRLSAQGGACEGLVDVEEGRVGGASLIHIAEGEVGHVELASWQGLEGVDSCLLLTSGTNIAFAIANAHTARRRLRRLLGALLDALDVQAGGIGAHAALAEQRRAGRPLLLLLLLLLKLLLLLLDQLLDD